MSDELRDRLRDLPIPEERESSERSWRVVRVALTDAEPRTRARTSKLRLVPIALGFAALLAALALTPAGASVRKWIADTIKPGEKHAKPALTAVPGGGGLLVQSSSGPWLVHSDGSKRLLGDYEAADFSPRGRFVAVTAGHELTAIQPDGTVRWSLSEPRTVSDPSWETYPGYRVAYRSGRALRVAIGDGSSNHLLAARTAPVTAAWRPVSPSLIDSRTATGLPIDHSLAFVAGGRVQLEDADTGTQIWRSDPYPGVRSLEWSADGSRLLITYGGGAVVLDRSGRVVAKPLTGPISSAVIDAAGQRIAALSHSRARGSVLRVVDITAGKVQARFAGPGRFDAVAWSPDSRSLLLSWKAADQWLFFRPSDEHVTGIGSIAEQFAPGERSPSFPRLLGWCCPAG